MDEVLDTNQTKKKKYHKHNHKASCPLLQIITGSLNDSIGIHSQTDQGNFLRLGPLLDEQDAAENQKEC
jgi:hypothetical protein